LISLIYLRYLNDRLVRVDGLLFGNDFVGGDGLLVKGRVRLFGGLSCGFRCIRLGRLVLGLFSNVLIFVG
jgi:hypothetical protein